MWLQRVHIVSMYHFKTFYHQNITLILKRGIHYSEIYISWICIYSCGEICKNDISQGYEKHHCIALLTPMKETFAARGQKIVSGQGHIPCTPLPETYFWQRNRIGNWTIKYIQEGIRFQGNGMDLGMDLVFPSLTWSISEHQQLLDKISIILKTTDVGFLFLPFKFLF